MAKKRASKAAIKSPRLSTEAVWHLPLRKKAGKSAGKVISAGKSALPEKPNCLPADIRGRLRVLNNTNFQPVPEFRIFRGNVVFRLSDPLRRPLQVVGHQGNKLFLNDLTYVEERDVCKFEDAEFFEDRAG